MRTVIMLLFVGAVRCSEKPIERVEALHQNQLNQSHRPYVCITCNAPSSTFCLDHHGIIMYYCGVHYPRDKK